MSTKGDNELIQDFLREDLSPEQHELVLKRLESDVDFRAAFMLEQQQHEALDETNWNFIEETDSEELDAYEALYKSEKTRSLKEVLKIAASNYKSESSSRSSKKWIFYSVAAVLAIMFFTFSIFSNDKTTQELYVANFDVDKLLGVAVRGDTSDSLLLQAEALFNSKAYDDAIPLIDKSLDLADKNVGILYLYKGISHMELNQFETAETTFNTLIESGLLDAQKGYWYKALLYVKMDNPKAAIRVLTIITTNNYFNKERAALLLKKLK